MLLFFSQNTVGTATTIKPKYGPRKAPFATPLYQDHLFFMRSKQPQFWALISYYIPQFNGYSCSTASVAMVINAARTALRRTADDKIISELDLLNQVQVESWKDKLSPNEKESQHGMSLDQLQIAIKKSFEVFALKEVTVTTTHIQSKDSQAKRKVIENLKKLSMKTFIIANFDQKVFTGDTQVGHFAPVGAYDPQGEKVLILDPDRKFYEPYWVTVDTFIAGMSTLDTSVNQPRGYLLVSI